MGAEGDETRIRVFWELNPEPDVAGDLIYRGRATSTARAEGPGHAVRIPPRRPGERCEGGDAEEPGRPRLDGRHDGAGGSPICYGYWVRAYDAAQNLYQEQSGCPASKDEYACARLIEADPAARTRHHRSRGPRPRRRDLVDRLAGPGPASVPRPSLRGGERSAHVRRMRAARRHGPPRSVDGSLSGLWRDPCGCAEHPRRGHGHRPGGAARHRLLVSGLGAGLAGQRERGRRRLEDPRHQHVRVRTRATGDTSAAAAGGPTGQRLRSGRALAATDRRCRRCRLRRLPARRNGVWRRVSGVADGNTFDDVNALRGTSYDYRVQSIDDRGRLSDPSAPVTHSYYREIAMSITDTFDPDRDGWIFENWGESSPFSWDLFEKTYAGINPTMPLDIAFYEIFKNCASNGNCGGMSLLALAMFKHGAGWDSAARRTSTPESVDRDRERALRGDQHPAGPPVQRLRHRELPRRRGPQRTERRGTRPTTPCLRTSAAGTSAS